MATYTITTDDITEKGLDILMENKKSQEIVYETKEEMLNDIINIMAKGFIEDEFFKTVSKKTTAQKMNEIE